MKYAVIIALALATSACQRAVPTEVISAGTVMATESSSGDAASASTVSEISNEQDFEIVSTAQTVESDAERIAANRAKYIVMDVQASRSVRAAGPMWWTMPFGPIIPSGCSFTIVLAPG